jgi:hypothetical protein
MRLWLVTVRVPHNRVHNSHKKQSGECPAQPGAACTDITGEHHTIGVYATSMDSARSKVLVRFKHITRIEEM